MGRVVWSEVPACRYWLRFLDAPLAKESRDVGALGFDVGTVPRALAVWRCLTSSPGIMWLAVGVCSYCVERILIRSWRCIVLTGCSCCSL
jgi:hypothetical protein